MTLRAAFIATALLSTAAVPAFAQTTGAKPAATPDTASAATPAAEPATPAADTAEPAAPAASASTTAAAATPAGSATVAAGAAVTDAKGGAVGTIASVNGDVAVVDTGAIKASIPVKSFAKTDNGFAIGMTKAELEAAAKGASATQQQQFLASLAPGTAVTDQNGAAVGTIEAVEGDLVTVATPKAKAKLPKSAIAQGPKGAVIGMTQAQLEAAAKASTPPAG